MWTRKQNGLENGAAEPTLVPSHTHTPLPSQICVAGHTETNKKRLTDIMHRLHTRPTPHNKDAMAADTQHGSKSPSSRRPPLTTVTQSLQGPRTPSFSHRSRSLSLGVVRARVTSAAVDTTAVTGPHSCCTSTPSTASSAGAGVVPAIRTTMREPSMVATVGGSGDTPIKAIRASCETNHSKAKAKGDSGPRSREK